LCVSFHSVLDQKYSDWNELENRLIEIESENERGKAFEDFVYLFLDLKRDLYNIEELYQENEIPTKYRRKLNLESTDYGVDGLIVSRDGDLYAYQVKFRSDRNDTPSHRELSKFYTEGSKSSQLYVITNAYDIASSIKKKEKIHFLSSEQFDDLEEDFFERLHSRVEGEKTERTLYDPYDFQEEIINDVVDGFKQNDRGKLIAACGTGKTLMSLWISERLDTDTVLFVAPSLALVRQTIDEWTSQASEEQKFDYLAVCSDSSVDAGEDHWELPIEDVDIPVSTDQNEVNEFIEKDHNYKKVVFSTYHSLDRVMDAIDDSDDFSFDLTIFDEAHRTAGTSKSDMFSLGLSNDNIPSKRRLFMTATERLVTPQAKSYVENNTENTVFSMDDKDRYGDIFAKLNFGKAIEKGVISDYEIVTSFVKEEELFDYLSEESHVKTIIEDQEVAVDSEILYKQLVMAKSYENLSISKVFSFHNLIKSSKAFSKGSGNEKVSLNSIVNEITDINEGIFAEHIDGSMRSSKRRRIFDEFEDANLGLISNARCLTEGVDVPKVDCTYFADPKQSIIDIVQASGRALRKTKDDKEDKAYLLIPVLIPEGTDPEEIPEKADLDQLFNVIQAMRDQDDRIEEWVNEVNWGQATASGGSSNNGPVINIPDYPDIDVQELKDSIELKISENIPEPQKKKFTKVSREDEDRSSNFTRKMRPLGDYDIGSYKNLIDSTLEKFESDSSSLPTSKVNEDDNNARSHTLRIGLIEKDENGDNKLSELGKQYKMGDISFSPLFKEQLLKFNWKEYGKWDTQPYLSIMRVLKQTKELTQLEFVYGPYAMEKSGEKFVSQALNRIEHIRNNYPKIEKLNESNQKKALAELNERFGLNFSYKDVWSTRTTTYNQHRYYRKQLGSYDFIDQNTDRIKIVDEEKLENVLDWYSENKDERSYHDRIESNYWMN
jgi:predicted helicase